MRIKYLALAAVLAAALSGPAQAVLIAAEEAVEATTVSLSLPASAQGVIVAKTCPSCALAVLRLTPETRFLVGKTQVTYAQLQKFIATGGTRNMVVLYAPRTHVVTRVIVMGELPKTKR
jgi:hypothetical protein